MRSLVAEAGLEDEIEIDSAGTGDWHIGHPPDARSTDAARARGITSVWRGPAGDRRRLRTPTTSSWRWTAPTSATCCALAPDEAAREKVVLLRSFDPTAGDDLDVPDPYYGGDDGFETVLDVVDRGARGLLERIRSGDRGDRAGVRLARHRAPADRGRGRQRRLCAPSSRTGAVVFVKHRDDPPRRVLRRPRRPGSTGFAGVRCRCPRWSAWTTRFLALAWIERGSGYDEAELGRGLAQLHALGAAASAPSGSSSARSTSAGVADDWPSLYGSLLSRLSPSATVERVIGRLGDLCGPRRAARPVARRPLERQRHGGRRRRPWLIDPAAYGGHREVDLAMLRLFGSPGPAFLAAYEDVTPLADGHEDRVALYQLLPLLVHAALFGGHYAAAADRAASRYL